MKNKIICLISILPLLLTGCSNTDSNIKYKEDLQHQYSDNYTYKFIGESEHFYFETGKVYYNGNERELLISNFKLKDNMSPATTYLVNLYFNDKLLYGNDFGKADLTKKEYMNIVIEENGKLGEIDQNGDIIGESDSFLETTKENFKNSIKLEIKYCQNSKCNTEKLQLTYVD